MNVTAGMLGADLQQMDQLERQFRTHAQNVDGLGRAITGALEGTAWTGVASQQFRDEWHQTYVPTLRGLSERLNEHATVVAKRREAIRAATS